MITVSYQGKVVGTAPDQKSADEMLSQYKKTLSEARIMCQERNEKGVAGDRVGTSSQGND